MTKKHDFDAAWKGVLEVFEEEVVELLFPELYSEIDWGAGTESLDQELHEIQKEIFDKASSEKIISDKVLKVRLKNKDSRILFVHVEVQSYSQGNSIFSERMFRYFYRIWDRFRYKQKDKSDIIAAAIYTYKGSSGKDKSYIYRLPHVKENILSYNFRTIDVEELELDRISDENPIKMVFKIAKKLLETGASDIEIYNAKIELARDLEEYHRVKNTEQIKALVDFLEYLFLIDNNELEEKYEDFKKSQGGVFGMTIDEIRKKYYTQKGIEKGQEKGEEKNKIQNARNLLDLLSDELISERLGLDIEKVRELRKEETEKNS